MISRGTKRDNIPSAVAFAVTVGFDALAGLYFERAAAESVIADRLFRCGRQPADAHHLRFAQHRALGRKVSDEFTVPLCRGHHRELHRCGDEAAWWKQVGIDPTVCALALWLASHPHPVTAKVEGASV